MDFLIPSINADWASTEPNEAETNEELARSEAEKNEEGLKSLLSTILGARNLLVLAGSGSSMCIKDEAGGALAPSMVDLWVRCRARVGDETFEQLLADVKYDKAQSGENIEYLLSQCQLAYQFNGQSSVRDAIAEFESEIASACSFLNENVTTNYHEIFLRKIARRSIRLPRACVFTTNYDLCFETACARTGFIVIDGFSYSVPHTFSAEFFNYDFVRNDSISGEAAPIPNVVRLLKLHGSVDWEYEDGKVVKTSEPDSPHLIYPQSTKYESSYKRPFFDVMSRFHSMLRAPNTTAVIVGFGFNDDHISAPIRAAIRENVNLRVALVSPSLKTSDNSNIEWIRSLARTGDSRINLIASAFEDFVQVMPDLVADMNEEIHRSRIQGH